MPDVENFSVAGVPLPVADAQAREDIAAINASLTQLTPTSADLSYTDTKGIMGTVYTRKIMKTGALKIVNLVFTASKSTTATLNTWYDLFTLPTGYDCTVGVELLGQSQGGNFLLDFQVTTNGKIQYCCRKISTTNNDTVYAQIVFV